MGDNSIVAEQIACAIHLEMQDGPQSNALHRFEAFDHHHHSGQPNQSGLQWGEESDPYHHSGQPIHSGLQWGEEADIYHHSGHPNHSELQWGEECDSPFTPRSHDSTGSKTLHDSAYIPSSYHDDRSTLLNIPSPTTYPRECAKRPREMYNGSESPPTFRRSDNQNGVSDKPFDQHKYGYDNGNSRKEHPQEPPGGFAFRNPNTSFPQADFGNNAHALKCRRH
jgi:hypothetical protein